jgi:hypothetical protein
MNYSGDYNGGRGRRAAYNDNEHAERAWERIWPIVSRDQFNGAAWRDGSFGSQNDIIGIDGWAGHLAIGRRVQVGDWDSFTARSDPADPTKIMEYHKLVDQLDRSSLKIQAYILPDWNGQLYSYGCVKTSDLIAFMRRTPRDPRPIRNGLDFRPYFFDELQRAGIEVFGRWRGTVRGSILPPWPSIFLQAKTVAWASVKLESREWRAMKISKSEHVKRVLVAASATLGGAEAIDLAVQRLGSSVRRKQKEIDDICRQLADSARLLDGLASNAHPRP